MEIAAAGDNHKELRAIARALLAKAREGDLQAIEQVANRTDGKPAQEQALTIDDKRDATDWGTAELVAFLDDLRASVLGDKKQGNGSTKPDPVH